MNEPRVYRVGDRVKCNGTEYAILDRENDVIIAEDLDPRLNVPTAFEVWRVRTLASDHKTPSGSRVQAGTEVLPKPDDWGAQAWTYSAVKSDRATALKAARRRMQWLLDGRRPEDIEPVICGIFA